MGNINRMRPLMIIMIVIIIVAAITRNWVYFALSLVYAVLYSLNYSAAKGEVLSQQLLSVGFGPNMDVPNMTREELLKSGIRLLFYALTIPIIVLPITMLLDMENLIFMGIIWGISIIFLMCFGGGLYLIGRGVFRSKKYIPKKKREGLNLNSECGDFFKQLENLDATKLSSYLKSVFEELKPILMNIDPERIDQTSYIKTTWYRLDYTLDICIQSRDSRIAGIYLSGERGQLILGYGGSEQLCNSNPRSDPDPAIREVTQAFEAYLRGITIIESIDKKGGVIKREHYFSADDESNALIKIGTEYRKLFGKEVTQNKYSYRFLK